MVALISFLLLGSLLLSLLGGCAPSKQSVLPGSISTLAAVSPHSFSGQAAASSEDQDSMDLERLALLWRERQQAAAPTDYPLGPGDVLEISVIEKWPSSPRSWRWRLTSVFYCQQESYAARIGCGP